MEEVRVATAADFGELMDFIDRVFRPGQKGKRIVQRQYPHLYRSEKGYISRHLVLRDSGEIIGQMAIHPLELRLEQGLVLRAGGIGTVATHPERRGEGVMGRLLQEGIRIMRQRAYDLSILGGDRQRYGWFGWENAGIRTVFELSKRTVGSPSAAERGLSLTRNPVLDSALRRRIRMESERRQVGVVRAPRTIEPLLCRTSRDLWVVRDGRRFAYLVLGGARHRARPYERVDEAGGDRDLVHAALRVLMARYRLHSLRAIAGPDPLDIQLYEPISSAWNIASDMMVNLLEPGNLLSKLEPLVRQRAQARKVAGQFYFLGPNKEPWGRWGLGAKRRYELVLSERELVRMCFGHMPLENAWSSLSGVDLLARILPLKLFVPPLNHV